MITAVRAVPIQLEERATGQAALRQIPVEIADLLEDRQYQLERVAFGWDFAEEHARLRMLEEIYDPETTRRLANIGVTF